MTREDIERLNDVEPYCFESDREEQWYNIGLKDGLEIADNDPKSPWISANDKLPAKGGHYLCMDDNHNITSLAFLGNSWFNSRTFADVPLDVVIYWMPIPDLPKE